MCLGIPQSTLRLFVLRGHLLDVNEHNSAIAPHVGVSVPVIKMHSEVFLTPLDIQNSLT